MDFQFSETGVGGVDGRLRWTIVGEEVVECKFVVIIGRGIPRDVDLPVTGRFVLDANAGGVHRRQILR